MLEHNGDIKRFLMFLKEENCCTYDNDIDYSIIMENVNNDKDTEIKSDILAAISKLESYCQLDGTYDYKSGFQAGLIFAIEILENILDKNNTGE